MNLEQALRTTIVTALNGQVTQDGNILRVVDAFDFPGENPEYPYVVIGAQESSQRNGKNRRPYDATIVIDIVTGFLSPEGRAQSEEIQEQVDKILNPESRVMLDASVNGWKIGDINQQNSKNLTNRNKLYYIYRKLTTYSLIVTKL